MLRFYPCFRGKKVFHPRAGRTMPDRHKQERPPTRSPTKMHVRSTPGGRLASPVELREIRILQSAALSL